ncbi:hypothetical protein SPLC1_S060030 [Arthrospira platensis C1]|nr:hypothetical protein SPLC1_S060030 [Arthrospira platensis C1]
MVGLSLGIFQFNPGKFYAPTIPNQDTYQILILEDALHN